MGNRTKYVDYRSRQLEILGAIKNKECTIGCAAAIHADETACHCRCFGRYHGALWIDELVVDIYYDNTSTDEKPNRKAA